MERHAVFLRGDFTTGGPAPSRGLRLYFCRSVARVFEGCQRSERGTPPHVPPATSPLTRPRIGLVLSGGGARGAAHVGVLKVLEQLHIPIDAVAGTSMGAVVGGLYAIGLCLRRIESIMTSLNSQDAFRDKPPRGDLTFRRKQEDQNFLVKFPLGIRGSKIQLP